MTEDQRKNRIDWFDFSVYLETCPGRILPTCNLPCPALLWFDTTKRSRLPYHFLRPFHSIYFDHKTKQNNITYLYISRKFLVIKISSTTSGFNDCLLFSKIWPDKLNTRSDVGELAGTLNKRLFIKMIRQLLCCWWYFKRLITDENVKRIRYYSQLEKLNVNLSSYMYKEYVNNTFISVK